MNMKNKKAFTLVELIVVISILAILWTIAFVSLQWYTRDARDSARISDMQNIEKWLELTLIKNGSFPVPDDKIDISASGVIVSYQWYAWNNVLNTIWIHWDWVDPLDETYYTYVVNASLTKYQLLWYLESTENISYIKNNNFLTSANALDLNERFLKFSWKELWILLLTWSLLPAQTLSSNIDIVTTTNEYISYLNNTESWKRQWTWSTLEVSMYHLINPKWSCNTILKNWKGNTDGIYTIDPEKNWVWFKVYCDMTTDWGGWTMLAHAVGEWTSVFDYGDIISWTPRNSDNCSTSTECLSESWVQLKNWDSLMVYTRWYKVKGTECNDKSLSIKWYSWLESLLKVSITTNWFDLSSWAHWKCDNLFEVSQWKQVSAVSDDPVDWPIRMGVRFTSNDDIYERSLLFYGPTFIPQGLWNTRWGTDRKLSNLYSPGNIYPERGSDRRAQPEDWDWASIEKQTWFVR